MSSLKFWKFMVIFFSKCTFCSLSSLLLRIPLCAIWYFWCYPTGLLGFIHFSSFFFLFLLPKIDNLGWLLSTLLILFALEPLPIIVFLSSGISIWLLFIISPSSLIFLYFIFFGFNLLFLSRLLRWKLRLLNKSFSYFLI